MVTKEQFERRLDLAYERLKPRFASTNAKITAAQEALEQETEKLFKEFNQEIERLKEENTVIKANFEFIEEDLKNQLKKKDELINTLQVRSQY